MSRMSRNSYSDLEDKLQVESLSTDELKELINNEDKLSNLVDGLEVVKARSAEKELKIASNKSVAEYNLSREPHLVEGRQRLFELNSRAEMLAHSVEEKITNLKNNTGSLSLETSLGLLKASASESEEQSDKIAEKFLEGEIDLESFVEQFSVIRKLMHLRRIKSDKMVDLIKAIPSPMASYFATPPMATVPYPQSINMPMPSRFGPSY